MGNQQILLLIVGTVIVTLAVTAGIMFVRESYSESVGDQIQQVLQQQAENAKVYHMKPKSLGGGSGGFTGFSLSSDMKNVAGVSYMTTISNPSLIMISARAQDGILHVGVHYADGAFKVKWIGTGTLKRYSTNEMTF